MFAKYYLELVRTDKVNHHIKLWNYAHLSVDKDPSISKTSTLSLKTMKNSLNVEIYLLTRVSLYIMIEVARKKTEVFEYRKLTSCQGCLCSAKAWGPFQSSLWIWIILSPDSEIWLLNLLHNLGIIISFASCSNQLKEFSLNLSFYMCISFGQPFAPWDMCFPAFALKNIQLRFSLSKPGQ